MNLNDLISVRRFRADSNLAQTRYRIGGLDVAWIETHYKKERETGRLIVSHYAATLERGEWYGAQRVAACACCGGGLLHRTWTVGKHMSARAAIQRAKSYIIQGIQNGIQNH